MHAGNLTRPVRATRWIWLAAVLALTSAACSGDDDDGAAAPAAETSTIAPDTTADVSTTTATAATDPGDGADPTTTVTDGEPAEPNTASFRGVTEDTIKVGVTVADFEALRELGVQNYWGDAEIVYQSFFDAINAAGGIHGRLIEPVYAGFSYLSPESQDAACTQLTEDEEVFIVFAGLLSESNLCFTELHETMVMTGGFLTDNLRERSGETLWLSLDALSAVPTRALAEAAAESGELGGKNIGIITGDYLDGGALGTDLQATLEELGFESTVVITSAPIDDEVAGDAELDAITQRFIADDIDFVFMLTNGAGAHENFAAAGYQPQIANHTIEAALEGVADPTILDGVLGIAPVPSQRGWDDSEFQSNCVDVVLAANPELAEEFDQQVPSGPEQADGQANWWGPISWACGHTRLFSLIAEIAGADLTNDSFRAALDELGPVDLEARGQVSYRSADKWDGSDEFFLVRYDAASAAIDIVGDPIVLDR
jgi:ABC-type branched-subunit amino acid transport system substrate-binding protein